MADIAKRSLVDSSVDRQNILNNSFAVREIEKATGITGIPYEGKMLLLKEQVASFLEIDVRTVENYLQSHSKELSSNGYVVLRGKALVSLKKTILELDVPEIDFGNIKMSPQLGVFDFRAFLNLAMLVAESDRARLLRRMMLDIVIDTVNFRSGGGTKYINQRDEEFIHSTFHGGLEMTREKAALVADEHIDLESVLTDGRMTVSVPDGAPRIRIRELDRWCKERSQLADGRRNPKIRKLNERPLLRGAVFASQRLSGRIAERRRRTKYARLRGDSGVGSSTHLSSTEQKETDRML